MEIERFQHIEVRDHVAQQGNGLRADCIDVDRHILILDGLRHQLLVLLLLSSVLVVSKSLLTELFQQTSDLMPAEMLLMPV